MSPPLDPTDVEEIFTKQIIPSVFESGAGDGTPSLLLRIVPGPEDAPDSVGTSGDSFGPVVSAQSMRAMHPRFAELSASGDVELAREVASASATWLGMSLEYARAERLSLTVQGSFASPAAPLGLIRSFQGAGFDTHLILSGVSRGRSLLSAVSAYFGSRRSAARADPVDVASHLQTFDGVAMIAAALDADRIGDRVTVVDSNGDSAFDQVNRRRTTPEESVLEALSRTRRMSLSTLGAARWMSELRRATEEHVALRHPPLEVTGALAELHEITLRDVVPALPIPPGSDVFTVADRRLTTELVALRVQLASAETADVTEPMAPVIVPSGPVVVPSGPDRGGISR